MPSEIYIKAAKAGAPIVDLVRLTRRMSEDIFRVRQDWDAAAAASNVDLERHQDEVTLAGAMIAGEGHEAGLNNRWRHLVEVNSRGQITGEIQLLIVVPVTEAGLIGEVQIRCKNQLSSGELLCTIIPGIDENIYMDAAALDQAEQYAISAPVQAAEGWLVIDFSQFGIVKELGTAFGILLQPSAVDGDHVGINLWESDHPLPYYSSDTNIMYWNRGQQIVRANLPTRRSPVTDAAGNPRCVEFRVATQGYQQSGSITVIFDTGGVPDSQATGMWLLADWVEPGAAISHAAWASDTGAFSGEQTSLGAVTDGQAIAVKKRYYKLTTTFSASVDRLSGAGLIEAGPRFTRTDTFAMYNRPIWGHANTVAEIEITEGSVNPEQGESSSEKPYIRFKDEDISRRLQEYDYQGEEVSILRGYDYAGFTENDCEVRARALIMDYEQDDKVSLETINLLKDLSERKLPRQSEDPDVKTIVNIVDTHPVDAAIILMRRAGIRSSLMDTAGLAAVKAIPRIADYRVRRILDEEQGLDELLSELLTPLLMTMYESGGKIGISRIDWSATPAASITGGAIHPNTERFMPRLKEGRGYHLLAYGERPDGEGGRYYRHIAPALDAAAIKRFNGKGEVVKYPWLPGIRTADAETIAADLLFARKRGLPLIEVEVDTALAWLQPGMAVEFESSLYRRRGVSETNPLLCHVAQVVPERDRVELSLVVMLDAQDSAPGGVSPVGPPAGFTASEIDGGAQFELTASADPSVTLYRIEQALAGSGKWRLKRTFAPGDFSGGTVLWQDIDFARLAALDFRAVAVAGGRRSEPVTVSAFRVQSTALAAPVVSLLKIQGIFKLTLDSFPAGAVALLIEHRRYGEPWERIEQEGNTFAAGQVIAYYQPPAVKQKIKDKSGIDRFRVACVDKYGQAGTYTGELSDWQGTTLADGDAIPGAVAFGDPAYSIVHQAHGDYYRTEALLNLVLPSADIEWLETLEVRRRSNGGSGETYGEWEMMDVKPLRESADTPPPIYIEYRDASQLNQGWSYQYQARLKGNNGIYGPWQTTPLTIAIPEDTTAPDVPSFNVIPLPLKHLILFDPATEGEGAIKDFSHFQLQAYVNGEGFWFDVEQRKGVLFEHPFEAADLGKQVKYRAKAWDTSNNSSAWSAETGWNTVLKVGLTALDTEVNSLLAQVTTNQNNITTHGTLISQNASAILLRAYQTSLDTTNGNVSTNTADISLQATQIGLRVKWDGNATSVVLSTDGVKIKASLLKIDGNVEITGDAVIQGILAANGGIKTRSGTNFMQFGNYDGFYDAISGYISSVKRLYISPSLFLQYSSAGITQVQISEDATLNGYARFYNSNQQSESEIRSTQLKFRRHDGTALRDVLTFSSGAAGGAISLNNADGSANIQLNNYGLLLYKRITCAEHIDTSTEFRILDTAVLKGRISDPGTLSAVSNPPTKTEVDAIVTWCNNLRSSMQTQALMN